MKGTRREVITSGLALGAAAPLLAMGSSGFACIPRSADAETDFLLSYKGALTAANSEQKILTLGDRRFSCRTGARVNLPAAEDLPLVVALHGGTYTSRYFDIPGYSLMARAAALGIPVLALDRPGYGQTPLLQNTDASLARNAEILDRALATLWERQGCGRAGILLIGHSIGGAVVIEIAARQPRWPLLGIAISGIGLANAPDPTSASEAGRPSSMITVPPEAKDRIMFGEAGTFGKSVQSMSRVADAAMPLQEAIDIRSHWARTAFRLLAQVRVPVHYRQGSQDKLWIVDREQVQIFAAAFSAAPHVDADIIEGSGHCIDFHRIGASFQLAQLSFALRSAFSKNYSRRDAVR